MGFRVARKHALKLRTILLLPGVTLALLFSLLALATGGWVAALFAVLALPCGGLAVALERWLFFAEAEHKVTLYYGASAA